MLKEKVRHFDRKSEEFNVSIFQKYLNSNTADNVRTVALMDYCFSYSFLIFPYTFFNLYYIINKKRECESYYFKKQTITLLLLRS